jgi:hypothetical protein
MEMYRNIQWEASEFKEDINYFGPLLWSEMFLWRPFVSILDITGCLCVTSLCIGSIPPVCVCEYFIILLSDHPENNSMCRDSPYTEVCEIQKLLLAEAFCLIDHTVCSTQYFYFNKLCCCCWKKLPKDNSSIATQPQPQPQNASVPSSIATQPQPQQQNASVPQVRYVSHLDEDPDFVSKTMSEIVMKPGMRLEFSDASIV